METTGHSAKRSLHKTIRTHIAVGDDEPGAPKVGPLRGRLKRVFNIDIEICRECGGAVRIIACIDNPVVIEKILAHLQ